MERFGIVATDEELEDINKRCENYEVPPVFLQSDCQVSFHPYDFHGQVVVFVYAWDTLCITTVYLKSWFTVVSDKEWIPIKFKQRAKDRRFFDRQKLLEAKFGVNIEHI